MIFKFQHKVNQIDLSNHQEVEAKLLADYRNNHDADLIAGLFDSYIHLVFGVCMKYLENEEESKDAVMQIFEDIIKDLKTHKVDNFKSWLYIVSKNYCLKVIRRRKMQYKFETYERKVNGNRFVEIEDDLDHKLDNVEALKSSFLNGALESLKSEQRKCIELFYLQEKSYKETMELTGFSLKQVKSYIQNGKRNLKLKLNGTLLER